MSAGVVVAAPSPVSALGAALHVLASAILVAFVEEPVLEQAHGHAYVEYRERTGRFLPLRRRLNPGACSADGDAQSSSDDAARHGRHGTC